MPCLPVDHTEHLRCLTLGNIPLTPAKITTRFSFLLFNRTLKPGMPWRRGWMFCGLHSLCQPKHGQVHHGLRGFWGAACAVRLGHSCPLWLPWAVLVVLLIALGTSVFLGLKCNSGASEETFLVLIGFRNRCLAVWLLELITPPSADTFSWYVHDIFTLLIYSTIV